MKACSLVAGPSLFSQGASGSPLSPGVEGALCSFHRPPRPNQSLGLAHVLELPEMLSSSLCSPGTNKASKNQIFQKRDKIQSNLISQTQAGERSKFTSSTSGVYTSLPELRSTVSILAIPILRGKQLRIQSYNENQSNPAILT